MRLSDRNLAFAWTEAVTLVGQSRVPDDVYWLVRQQFKKIPVRSDLGDISLNGWNRLAIRFRAVAETYQPAPPPAAAVR